MPASLYWVNASRTIHLRSAPIVVPCANLPSTFKPILLGMKFVQFLTYGDLHLPLGPSFTGPGVRYPVTAGYDSFARTASVVGGNATAAPPGFSWPVSQTNERFSIKHPRLTWNTSFLKLSGTILTSRKSCPLTATSVLRPIGLFS